jgi:imidazolonepropionase-like amidohydrolase
VQEDVLIKNISIWTSEDAGVLKEHDIIISKGKISKIGKGLQALPGMKVIDGTGKHLSAGIIDEHSHIAVSDQVNEGSFSITSEVRIGDVIDSDDINIYRQLSGGVTTSHLLHGSANCIGGQTALIKLRWGKAPEAMKFEGADGFIKFALGENVKQSNWGDRNITRYPQTRMGVEQIYYDAFSRASAYDKQSKNLKPGQAFRRDLKLEALAEILNKKRFITCHSYVQSEINMLMHVADSFDFKINTFTHILEGYKVADKMKAHGVAGSTFADWWAYKYEVMEAIPHNASLMHRMGILTSVNSDDAEMARRLNQEAAKGIRYGGMSEETALRMVTIHPAKMLHIDNRTGSIKEGKDADLVIWTDTPLSVYAKAEKTFVDGICYYDMASDLELRKKNAEERTRIIALMMKEKGSGKAKPGMQVPRLLHCNDMEKLYHEHLPYEAQ